MSRVLVTGGAGFIGSNLAEALLKKGHLVRVLDDFSTGKRENLIFNKKYPSLEIIEEDIRDLVACQKAIKGTEYVFHQAALPSVQRSIEDPEASNAINVGGTLNILLAAREEGVKRVIYASSSSIYGDTPTLPKHEEMPSNPLSPYALQKYIGEQYCRLFYQLYGLDTISLRYFNILVQNRTRTPFTLLSSPNLLMPCFGVILRSSLEMENNLETLPILRMWFRPIFSPCPQNTFMEKPLILPVEKEPH